MNPQSELTDGDAKRVDSPAQARQWLRSMLVDVAPPRSIDDACLLVSELVTNAFIHGRGSPAVRASLDADQLLLSVIDESSAQPVPRPFGAADETGGLGLTIVDRLTSAWGVDTVPGGKVVWAQMPLAGR
jgi:anti-sigma regulatory factor (Ser/Thr protein kinase)